jgi:hypothetical protein
MAVDEARRDGGFAKVFDLGRRESFNYLRARADGRDARAFDDDRASLNRFRDNGQNPTRAVDFRHAAFSPTLKLTWMDRMVRMGNAEYEVMNEEERASYHSSFRIPHSSFLLIL